MEEIKQSGKSGCVDVPIPRIITRYWGASNIRRDGVCRVNEEQRHRGCWDFGPERFNLVLVDVREIDTLNLNGFNTSSCEHLPSPVETGRGSLASLWTATTGDGVAPIDLEDGNHLVMDRQVFLYSDGA